MPTRLRVFYSLFTAALLFIPLVALYSELAKRPDISWDCVQRLPFLLIYSAAIGAGLVVILITATGRLAYRGERAAS